MHHYQGAVQVIDVHGQPVQRYATRCGRFLKTTAHVTEDRAAVTCEDCLRRLAEQEQVIREIAEGLPAQTLATLSRRELRALKVLCDAASAGRAPADYERLGIDPQTIAMLQLRGLVERRGWREVAIADGMTTPVPSFGLSPRGIAAGFELQGRAREEGVTG